MIGDRVGRGASAVALGKSMMGEWLKEKKMDPTAPTETRMRAMSFLGKFLNIGESCMTVVAASSMEKAESIPRVKRVIAKMKAHPLDPGRVSMAAG